MIPGVRILPAVLALCACLAIVAVALAAETVTFHASFNPDRLGASTNVAVTGQFASPSGGPLSPLRSVTAYAPAGMVADLRGAGTCAPARLESDGPSACPAGSRIGFGDGVGAVELANETIREPFTIDLFLAPRERGRLVLLAYVNAVSPVTVQLVLMAREVHGPKPYGFGIRVDVPTIPTLPGAANATVERLSLTLGATHVAYYKTLHGRRRLVHVRGIVVPKRCPRGGFPAEGIFTFADGTTTTINPTIPCPPR